MVKVIEFSVFQLKRRLAARQGKQKDEAAEVLSIGQRQKTTLEKTQKDEKDRQLQKIEEKRARMKEKRDPSPKVKVSDKYFSTSVSFMIGDSFDI